MILVDGVEFESVVRLVNFEDWASEGFILWILCSEGEAIRLDLIYILGNL